jgi:hypothetical protein
MYAAVAGGDAVRALAAGHPGHAVASLFQRGVAQSLWALIEELPNMPTTDVGVKVRGRPRGRSPWEATAPTGPAVGQNLQYRGVTTTVTISVQSKTGMPSFQ